MKKILIPAFKPEDWKPLLADPKHWRKGYSAMSLAYCWQESEGFPKSVNKIFHNSEYDLLHNLEILIAIPEYKVALPGGARPSQNDLFVLAKKGSQLISMMVEGKVAEPFGPFVSEWFKDASTGKEKRLQFLCKKLGLEQLKLNSIRYQLLHRTASALIAADLFNATNAMMLVHSFSRNNDGLDDYKNFAALFGIDAEINNVFNVGRIDGVNLYLVWVSDHNDYGP